MTRWKNSTRMHFTEEIEVGRDRIVLPVAILLLLYAMGPAYPQQPSAQESPLVFATGIGHPSPEAASPTQARAMAERAALLQAIREAAKKAGRPAPKNYGGTIRVGATVQGFRITRITPLPDGSIEIEVSVPPAGVAP
jgi:hypothetical protein